ncbi:MAG: phosphate signaling complex protein PhoU [Planctomycetales bacterium]|nr:phosphate signaling complex protein PhoU [Planctomycetales bacterium]
MVDRLSPWYLHQKLTLGGCGTTAVPFLTTSVTTTAMKKFDHELAGLRQRVVEMGNLAEKMVAAAIDAVTSANRDELIKSVEQAEEELDDMQVSLDKEAIRLLTVYSPVAADLRFVMSVSRINNELERIGDHAMNMCEAIQLMESKSDNPPLAQIEKMAVVVKEMMADALNAFLQDDIAKARETIASDDMVDALNDQIVEELLHPEIVRQAADGRAEIADALSQILIGRSLERIADQSTNISEEVIYMVRGQDVRHED